MKNIDRAELLAIHRELLDILASSYGSNITPLKGALQERLRTAADRLADVGKKIPEESD